MNTLHYEGAVLSPRAARRSKFGFSKLFIMLVMACLVGALSANATSGEDNLAYNGLRYGAAAAISAFIIGLSIFSRRKIGNLNSIMLVVWVMYSLFSMISALINGDEIWGELWQGVAVPVFAFIALPRLAGRQGHKIIAGALILGLGPYLAYSMATVPLFVPYQGILFNPNTLGMLTVAVLAGILTLLRGALGSDGRGLGKNLWISILAGALMVTVVLLLFSNSRTSLLAFILIFGLFFRTLLLDMKKTKFFMLTAIISLSVIITSVMFYVVLNPESSTFNMITEKFTQKTGDQMFSGRLEIWWQILGDTSLFGHGSRYLKGVIGIIAHNTYISVLATKGAVTAVFLLIFHVMVLLKAYRLAIKKSRQDSYATGPLMIAVCYLTLGLLENVISPLGNGIQMAFTLTAGMLMNSTTLD